LSAAADASSPSPSPPSSWCGSPLSFAAVGGGPSVGADSLVSSPFSPPDTYHPYQRYQQQHRHHQQQQQQHRLLPWSIPPANFVSPYQAGAGGSRLARTATATATSYDDSAGLRLANSGSSRSGDDNNEGSAAAPAAGSIRYYGDPFSYDLTDGSVAASGDVNDLDWNDDEVSNSYDPLPLDDGTAMALASSSPEDGSLWAAASFGRDEHHGSAGGTLAADGGASTMVRRMARELDSAHGGLRDALLAAPGGPERSALVSALAHWARDVAADPLAPPGSGLLLLGALPAAAAQDPRAGRPPPPYPYGDPGGFYVEGTATAV
jgi:hypothetical protein